MVGQIYIGSRRQWHLRQLMGGRCFAQTASAAVKAGKPFAHSCSDTMGSALLQPGGGHLCRHQAQRYTRLLLARRSGAGVEQKSADGKNMATSGGALCVMSSDVRPDE